MRVLCPGRIEIWREDNQLCRKPSALTKAPPLLQFSIFSTGNGLGCMQSAVAGFICIRCLDKSCERSEGGFGWREREISLNFSPVLTWKTFLGHLLCDMVYCELMSFHFAMPVKIDELEENAFVIFARIS